MTPSEHDAVCAIAIYDGAICGLEFRMAELERMESAADDALRRAISARRQFAKTALGEVACRPACRAAPIHCERCRDTSWCAVRASHANYVSAHGFSRDSRIVLYDDVCECRDRISIILGNTNSTAAVAAILNAPLEYGRR